MLGMSDSARALYSRGGMRSHRMVTRCQLWRGGLFRAEPRVIGGSVKVDGDALIRRSASVELDPTTIDIPRTPADVLYPGASEFLLWRGIDWRDGRAGTPSGVARTGEELWPLGVFWLGRTEIDDEGSSRRLTISGYDRAKCVQRNAWTAPYLIAEDDPALATWESILTDRFAGAEVDSSGVQDDTLAAQVLGDKPQADPWADAVKIGAALGAESYLSPTGTFLLRPLLDPSTLPSLAEYVESDPTDPEDVTALTGLKRTLDAEVGFNVVVGESNRSGHTPLRSVQSDEDPLSATYVEGDYRPAVRFLPNQHARTQAGLDRRTAAALARKIGALDSVSISIIVCPAHEAGDVVNVERYVSGVSGRYALRSFGVPLGADEAMDADVLAVGS